MRSTIFVMLSACFLWCASSGAQSVVPDPLTFAVQRNASPSLSAFFEQSLQELSRILQDRAVLTESFTEEEFADPFKLSQARFVLVSAPVFASLERYAGFSAIASVKPNWALDSNVASATTLIVVQNTRPEIVTLENLRGLRIGVPATDALEVRMHTTEELTQQGKSPQDFFKIISLEGSAQTLLEALKKGLVDVLALPCTTSYEILEMLPDNFKVVEPRLNLELNVPHSTGVYPGWVLAASIGVSREEADNFGALFRSLTTSDLFSWQKPADYRVVHQMLRTNRDVYYESFRKRSFTDYLREYADYLVFVSLILLGLMFHVLRANRLVRIRTEELESSHRDQREVQQRYEHLERASIVGQMSNLVAHELRQPLAAISNYGMGIRRRISNGTLEAGSLEFALSRILMESERANDIVRHVQAYAANRTRTTTTVNISKLLRAICSDYNDSQGVSRVTAEVADEIVMQVDSLEIELIVRNLIKNALEAGRAAGDPVIYLRAYIDSNASLRICVRDKGVPMNDESFRRLSMPLTSTKPDGLGLGLAVVRRIAESYGGHIEFARMQPQGLEAILVLPLEASTKSIDQTDLEHDQTTSPKSGAHC